MEKQQSHIDKSPKRNLKDPSGKATDNPKLSKQAEGRESQPSASKSPDPHRGIKSS